MSTEVEFGGVKFRGGKMFLLVTALSTLGGASWGAFQFYADYMNMKEIVANIDTVEISNQQAQLLIKLDDAISYTRDIKTGLRDDILMIEKQVDRTEDMVRDMEERMISVVQNAEDRFENKRDALQNDYDRKSSSIEDRVKRDLKDMEAQLNKKLQRALDNPLSN